MKAERRIKEWKKKKWNRKETEKEGRAGGGEYLPTRTWKSPKCTRRTQRRTQIIGDNRVSEISYFLVLHIFKVLFLLDLYQCKMCRVFFFFQWLNKRCYIFTSCNTCYLIKVHLFSMVMLHTANESSSL